MYVFDVSSIATIITLNIITLIFTIIIFLMKFKSFIKIINNNDIEKKDNSTQLSEIIIDENAENILSKEVLHLWTFKMLILVFVFFVFSYLIFLNIFGLTLMFLWELALSKMITLFFIFICNKLF